MAPHAPRTDRSVTLIMKGHLAAMAAFLFGALWLVSLVSLSETVLSRSFMGTSRTTDESHGRGRSRLAAERPGLYATGLYGTVWTWQGRSHPHESQTDESLRCLRSFPGLRFWTSDRQLPLLIGMYADEQLQGSGGTRSHSLPNPAMPFLNPALCNPARHSYPS